MTASLDVASLWLMWAQAHTCRRTYTHSTHTYTHMQTWTPMDILVCPNSSHDPAGIGTYRLPYSHPHCSCTPPGLGGRTPPGTARAGESQLAQAGPRTRAPSLPTGLEGEIHPRELHQGLSGEDGGDGKAPAPSANKAAGFTPCSGCGEQTAEQQGQLTWGRSRSPLPMLWCFLGRGNAQWGAPASCWHFVAGVFGAEGPKASSLARAGEEKMSPTVVSAVDSGPRVRNRCFLLCFSWSLWPLLPGFAYSFPGFGSSVTLAEKGQL